MTIHAKILNGLTALSQQGTERNLEVRHQEDIDFFSNDYFGFAQQHLSYSGAWGAAGSRLIGGHSEAIALVEDLVAHHYGLSAGLLFTSGYMANLGLISALADKHTTILMDAQCHASIKDGARLGQATLWKFKHNDLADFQSKLLRASGDVLVIVESLYSMSGDSTDIPAMLAIMDTVGIGELIVDDAHSFGIWPPQSSTHPRLLARMATLSKSAGIMGGIVVGSQHLRQFLINKARPFIYDTAISPAIVDALAQRLPTLLNDSHILHSQLASITSYWESSMPAPWRGTLGSPIKPIRISGVSRAKEAEHHCRQLGLGVKAIVSPTVPAHSELLRIVLHSFNTPEQVDQLLLALQPYFYA